MGTAHDAEELHVGLCSHGHACLAGSSGRYIGLCLGCGHIWKNQSKGRQKYSVRPITLSHDEILTNRVSFCVLIVGRCCRCGSRYRASKSPDARASYWHKLINPIYFVSPLVHVQLRLQLYDVKTS
jgi:hypothetical protein